MCVYCYELGEFSRRRLNNHLSGAPTCELLKRLVHSPAIPLHIH